MASFQLRDNIIQSITEKLQQFSFIRKQSYNIPKEKIASNQLMEICKAIKKEKKSLSSTVLKRQQSKYQRDNITIFDHPRKKRRFRKSKRRHHNNQRKLLYREKERKIIEEAKTTCPDQNAINLSNKDLSHAEQSLLRKGPSFIPTPTDIKWYNLRRDFDSFVNKLRYRVSKPAETSSINVNHTSNISNSLVRQLGNPPIEAKSSNVNFNKEKTNISSLEAFIELLEKDLFKPSNYSKIKGNITTEEEKANKTTS